MARQVSSIVGDKKVYWIKGSIFALIGGILALIVGQYCFLTAGESGTISAIMAAIYCVPPANVLGVSLYRLVSLKRWTFYDIIGALLGLLFSALGLLFGIFSIYALDRAGLLVILLGTCVGSTLGYALGSNLVVRSRRTNDATEKH